MAVVTTKSTAVTNSDALPQTLSPQRIDGGRLRERVGFVEATATDSIGSVYRLMRINSVDRVSRLLLSCDAITTAAGGEGAVRQLCDLLLQAGGHYHRLLEAYLR